MLTAKITTLGATFARIEAGGPLAAAFHKILTQPDGAQKCGAMSVAIRDERLLTRASRQIN